MLNKAPIFINGFKHGGTNILMNLIASHPGICFPGGETHMIFYGQEKKPLQKWVRRFLYLPVLVAARQHIFWPSHLYKRNTIPGFLKSYIDLIFYWSKMNAPRNKFKVDGTRNLREDIANSRTLFKNVNGVVLASSLFAEIYPDATFIGLVRNGFALCEGFMRRGWTAERFGKMYERVCQQMIQDAENMDNYHIIRFEDIISNPATLTKEIYDYAHLNIDSVTTFIIQAKKSMGKDGRRKYTLDTQKDREIRRFPLDQINHYLRKDVNDNQIARLSEQNKKILLQYTQESMGFFGYL